MQIDAPEIVRPINSHMELQALQHALGQQPDTDKGMSEHSILAGDLLHLRAQEVLTLPFLLQVHKGAQEDIFSQLSSNGQKLASNASSPSSPDAVRTVKLSLVSCTTGMEVLAPLAFVQFCGWIMMVPCRPRTDSFLILRRCARIRFLLFFGGLCWTGLFASMRRTRTCSGKQSSWSRCQDVSTRSMRLAGASSSCLPSAPMHTWC